MGPSPGPPFPLRSSPNELESVRHGVDDPALGSRQILISCLHNAPHMAKTVRLSDEAYALLTSKKGERESYSDLVRRLTGEKDPMLFVGRLEVSDDFDKKMAATRKGS